MVYDDLLIGDALVSALQYRSFTARLADPATPGCVEHALTWRPQAAVVDVHLAQEDGRALLKLLGEHDVTVVLMGAEFNRSRQLLAGNGDSEVAAFVASKTSLDDLLTLLNRLLGLPTRSDEADSREGAQPESPPGGNRDLLSVMTRREREVLADLMEGYSPDQIATRSYVSISTVRSQIKSILQKLGVNSQLAAVALVRQATASQEP